ncbi:theronine dehydrogenase-like Zn-dependent dehydrogenase [Thermobacillus composti KWC4]|uniref:Theronine dehydrogenase-like Zn-dependent dehydrogenase n=1 Tax=Thermobacillus composti (strain DSM 18247 / JCM 13945 / KWC4) TaxID=717605 RepID=L0EGQ0_THECK|nr:NAD(P)-dependent alcohol dehydrogenase [Thermobacillus composti]AGA58851.1 theronine dehydrogenase-like Zn-dependent dehydrogenase [Thermobacillus composti KWC4]
MQGKMKAAVLTKPGHIEIQELDIPTPGPDEALVRVRAVGLCGSDVHYYEHGKIGPYVVTKPIILGHEAAGEVVAVGSEVRHLKAGQRVTIEPGVTCGRCEYCKSGRYNLCPDVRFLATPPYDGAFCEYIAIRADFLYPIPDSMSYEKAALIEPLSVGLHAVSRGGLKTGETVVIMGMGPIGMMTLLAAKAAGAGRVIGVDLERFRLERALQMGADGVVNLREEDGMEAILRLTGGRKADLAIETAGNGKAAQASLQAVRRGGRVVLVGLPQEEATPLNIPYIVDNEIDIRGVFRYHNTYPTGVAVMSAENLNLDPIVTDRMTLDETPKAFEKAIKEKHSTLKIVIEP